MALSKLVDFLDRNEIRYVTVTLSPAYTLREMMAAERIAGKPLCRSKLVLLDNEAAMAVLPENEEIDRRQLQQFTGAHVRQVDDEEARTIFPDCEPGAVPPFGNLWNMKTIVTDSVAEDEEIAFAAGSRREMIKMNYADYQRLVRPRVLVFSRKVRHARGKRKSIKTDGWQ
jgi:Ala-tRNA(Pro) deacylase